MEQFPSHPGEHEPNSAARAAEAEARAAHEDALRAYLQLPDNTDHGPNLLEHFHNAYLGSFETLDDLLTVVRSEFAASAEAEGLDLKAMDRDALARAARLAWHIVEDEQRIHVFERTDEL